MAQASLCGRVGCGEPATCALLMAPQDTEAWLVGLDHDYAPDGVALCMAHADRITVPFGWSLSDDRPAARPKRTRRKKTITPAAAPAEAASAREPEPAPEPVVPSASEPAPESVPEAVDDEPIVHEAELDPETAVDEAAAEHSFRSEADADGALGEDEAAAAADLAVDDEVELEPVAAMAAEAREALVDATDPTDEPTIQLPTITVGHPSSAAEVPLNVDRTAAAVDDMGRRLSVVPGEDDPNKTFDFADDGQGALWAPVSDDVAREPDERTPMLKRAFRVVRDD